MSQILPVSTESIWDKFVQKGQAFFGKAANSVVAHIAQDRIILRQEVPIERYYFNYSQPFATTQDELMAHVVAVGYALEGAVRTVAEAVMLIASMFFNDDIEHARVHKEMFQLQAKSMALCTAAVIYPQAVTEFIAEHSTPAQPYIGCTQNHFDWGNRYNGQMTIPLFSIECSQYPHRYHPV